MMSLSAFTAGRGLEFLRTPHDGRLEVDPDAYRFARRHWFFNKRGADPAAVFADWQGFEKESWTFVGAHDDDMLIAQGRLIQYASAKGINVHVVVVTDGREGWVTEGAKDSIVATRREETDRACRWIGISPEQFTWIGIPDMEISNRLGEVQRALKDVFIEQNSTRIIYGWGGDPHTDHRATALAVAIAQFHAEGGLQANGRSLERPFHAYQTPVYLPAVNDYITAKRIPPDIQIESPVEAFYNYLRALREYRSQEQIEGLIQSRGAGGPFEHLYADKYIFYDAQEERRLFENTSILLRLTSAIRRSLRSGPESDAWRQVADAALRRTDE